MEVTYKFIATHADITTIVEQDDVVNRLVSLQILPIEDEKGLFRVELKLQKSMSDVPFLSKLIGVHPNGTETAYDPEVLEDNRWRIRKTGDKQVLAVIVPEHVVHLYKVGRRVVMYFVHKEDDIECDMLVSYDEFIYVANEKGIDAFNPDEIYSALINKAWERLNKEALENVDPGDDSDAYDVGY